MQYVCHSFNILCRTTDAPQGGIDLTKVTVHVHDGHDLEIFECPAYKETVGIEPLYEIIDDDLDPSQADGNTSHNVPIADDDCDDHDYESSHDNASDLDHDVYIECAQVNM